MKSRPHILGVLGILMLLPGGRPGRAADNGSEPDHRAETVSLRKMADGLHALLTATQQAYLRGPAGNRSNDSAPDRVGAKPVELPGHVAFLRTAADQMATHGAEFSFALRAVRPRNPRDRPQTQAEQQALDQLQRQPDQPLYLAETLGGRSYFTAVYPERVTQASCIACHNADPRSPHRDWQPGDLMGILVIRLPREF